MLVIGALVIGHSGVSQRGSVTEARIGLRRQCVERRVP